MFVFHEILKMSLKVKFCDVNKESILHIAVALTIHANYQIKKGRKIEICKNSSYCVSHAVEIW
jgi:hypothetical protein